MTALVGQKLLLAELNQLRLVVVDVVLVLVGYFDHLVVFFQDELGAFYFASSIEVGKDEQLIEGLFSPELCHI